MTIKTITRADLAHSIFRKIGLSGTESANLVNSILEEICKALTRGEDVRLSSFAAFNVRNKSGRLGRNPATGEEHQILPRRVISFTASATLRARIQNAHLQRKTRSRTRPVDPTR
ncbi:integration host factor subunit alpha (plasmid) [Rhizobium sp. CB3171]|uniref:integration host factor subunit alpha n=1 Tax=Rhizobium sp. CB3171 TaxID=3039157 RepID=UPI0024B1680E|nr:integration host factor subunit alpha [Rhizobium sp. CB3171]WFU07348.1 integration host factor subunit alpha [Rhizobium sp. CB3171]